MLRDALVTKLGYWLGNRTDLDDKIILELDYVQTFLLEGTGAFLPWFLETEMSTTYTAAGEERVALPTDFLGEIEEQSLWLYDENNTDAPYTELRKRDFDLLIIKHPISSIPEEYAITGDYLLIRPVPDDVYTLKMRYYGRDDSLLTENIENKWLKHAADLMIAETGAIMAANHLKNPQLAAKFAGDADRARQRLYTKHESRKHVNRIYSMGED